MALAEANAIVVLTASSLCAFLNVFIIERISGSRQERDKVLDLGLKS